MRFWRLVIAVLIVVGLAMPTARASFVSNDPPAMEDCEGMQAMGGEDCPCCDVDNKCPTNVCAIKCLQAVGTPPPPDVIFATAWGALELPPAVVLCGLKLRPPSPPPRV
jgi:hypothetical protein